VLRKRIDMAMRFQPIAREEEHAREDTQRTYRLAPESEATTEHLPTPRQIPDNSQS
jgi:hypothetical protein